MKKNILIIIFCALFSFNYEICNYIYTGGFDKLNSSEWMEYGIAWTDFRYAFFEFMFLIILASFLLVPNKYTRSLLTSAIVIVVFSFIDKALSGIITRHTHDVIVIGFSMLCGISMYRYENK